MLLSFFFSLPAAPENQALQNCSILSDMFSLGMVMCAIFNSGRALIQAGNSPSTYTKQLETVSIYRYCIETTIIIINNDHIILITK